MSIIFILTFFSVVIDVFATAAVVYIYSILYLKRESKIKNNIYD